MHQAWFKLLCQIHKACEPAFMAAELRVALGHELLICSLWCAGELWKGLLAVRAFCGSACYHCWWCLKRAQYKVATPVDKTGGYSKQRTAGAKSVARAIAARSRA